MTVQEIQNLYELSLERGESRTDFSGLDFSNIHVKGIDLRCCDFDDTNLSNTIFEDCDLRGSCFQGAKSERAKFIHCLIFDCEFPETYVKLCDCREDAVPRWAPAVA